MTNQKRKVKTETNKSHDQFELEYENGEALAQDLVNNTLARKETWKSAIQTMQKQKFSSLESAVEKLIDLALEPLGTEFQNNEELRDFLQATFQSDPSLLEDLKEAVQVK